MTHRSFAWFSMAEFGEVVARLDEQIEDRPEPDWSNEPVSVKPFQQDEWSFDQFGFLSNGPQITSGTPTLFKLKNVSVQRENHGIKRYHVLLADGICARETYHDGPWIGNKVADCSTGNVQLWDGKIVPVTINILSDQSIEATVDRPTVLISHQWANNYPHMLLETMSRWWAERDCPEGADILWETPLPFMQQMAELSGRDKRLVSLPAPRTLYRELWAPTMLCPYGHSRRQVEYLRSGYDQIVVPPVPPYDKVYISRSDAKTRRVTNEKELAAVLEPLGFTGMTLGQATVAEQISLFRHAKVIVAPHGAAVANVIFCQPGTVVIELIPQSYRHTMYGYVAAWSGLKYGRVVCPDTGGKEADMTVVVEDVTRALQEMGT